MNKFLFLLSLLFIFSCEKQEVKLKSSDKMCTLVDAAKNNWEVQSASGARGIKNFDDVSGCEIDSCIAGFSTDRNGQTCVPTIISCPVMNGSGTQTWNEDSYDSCVTQSCLSNYEIVANSCQPIACTVANSSIDNVATVSGDLVIGCNVVSCENEYQQIGNSCVGISCDLTNSIGNGLSSLDFVSTVSGTINNDSCLVSSCNQYYSVSTDSKSCEAVTSSCLSSDAALNNWNISQAATYSGNRIGNDISACEVSSCNANYEINNKDCTAIICTVDNAGVSNATSVSGTKVSGCLATSCASGYYLENNLCAELQCDPNFQHVNGNVCEDNDIVSASIQFNEEYTNHLDSNSVNLGLTTNAQVLGIYTDASCSNQINLYDLESFNGNIDLSMGADGIRLLYAQYFNGSKSSSCLEFSIILDRVAPVANFTTVANLNILNNQITIEGQCSDETDIAELTLSNSLSDSEVISCSNGVFSKTLDITSLSYQSPLNQISFQAEIKDKAGNSFLASSQVFSKVKNINIVINLVQSQFGKITSSLSNFNCSTSSCSGQMLNNQDLILNAELLTNGKFVSWGGSCSGSENQCTLVNIQSDKTITANFDADQYLIANNDNQSTQQAQTLVINASSLLANDQSAFNRIFNFIGADQAVGGSVSSVGNIISFIPSVLTGDEASFRYTIQDSEGLTKSAIVSIDITPLPNIQALIFDESEFSYINDLLTATPPTLADLFDTWGRFEEKASSNYTSTAAIVNSTLTAPGAIANTVYPLPAASRYYDNKTDAIGARTVLFPSPNGTQVVQGLSGGNWYWFELLSWQFLSNPDRVESTVNSNNYIGFLSPKKYDSYELETMLSSTSTDDDTVGVVIAYYRDEVNSQGYTLSLVRTQGGNNPANGFGIVYNVGQAGSYIIDSRDVGGVFKNITGTTTVPLSERNGWAGRSSLVKVQRNEDLIKVFAGVWGSTELDPNSLIELDLNSDPRLLKFKGPQKYGFAAYSQANSSFVDIKFTAGGDLNQSLVYDLENNIVYEYVTGTGWQISSVDFQDSLGYPREIFNPRTNKTYVIDRNGEITLKP